MNARKRFLETMRGGNPDRAPLFDEGFRDDVIKNWQSQGLSDREQLKELFYFDHANAKWSHLIDLDNCSINETMSLRQGSFF